MSVSTSLNKRSIWMSTAGALSLVFAGYLAIASSAHLNSVRTLVFQSLAMVTEVGQLWQEAKQHELSVTLDTPRYELTMEYQDHIDIYIRAKSRPASGHGAQQSGKSRSARFA